MLRTLVLGFGSAMLLAGLLMLRFGAAGTPLILSGALFVLGVLLERWRYRKRASPPGTHWQPTGERFADPHSGKEITVLYDPASGERRYAGDE